MSEIFLLSVADRTIQSLTSSMRGLILPASIINTDGHPSYPATTRNLGLDHNVVC